MLESNNYGGAITMKVKTLYLSDFNIPHSCVACGAPPGIGTTLKMQVTKSDWSGKHTTGLSLNLPLCQECYDVNQSKGSAKFIMVLGILLSLGTCGLGARLANSFTDNSLLALGIGLVLFIAVIYLFIFLANQASQRGFTAEQRERRKRVRRCARIAGFKQPGTFDKTGWIQFEFENPAYAGEFSQLNLGNLS